MRGGVVSCFCFWCWWVSFIWEVEVGTGGEFPSEDMLIIFVLTYVGDRKFTDDGRGCCQTGGSRGTLLTVLIIRWMRRW